MLNIRGTQVREGIEKDETIVRNYSNEIGGTILGFEGCRNVYEELSRRARHEHDALGSGHCDDSLDFCQL